MGLKNKREGWRRQGRTKRKGWKKVGKEGK